MHDLGGLGLEVTYVNHSKIFVLNLGWTGAKLATSPRSMLLRSNKLLHHPCRDDYYEGVKFILKSLYDRFISIILIVYKEIDLEDVEDSGEDPK